MTLIERGPTSIPTQVGLGGMVAAGEDAGQADADADATGHG